ncbi:hypothetical protein PRK78_004681 [Emydomyces testavorans]|uniref:AAA+ ATPase domain-containing protein n=1 Tax=Emydomyces testavorans TaxID=2070801 RepID=A0AAF0DKC3_9EURO|nr:hypothetical protein PRK78_004681 [Emydomyces testavorans]
MATKPAIGVDLREPSPIWQAAIDRYYEELKRGGIKGPAIEKDLWDIESPHDLLDQLAVLLPADPNASKSWMIMLRRLEPVLLSLNDFAAVISCALGMNGRVAAVIWGSIRLILKFAQPILPSLLDMFDDLERALPRFRKYERELPMTDALEDALSDMYTEIIVFCAHAITVFRNNPNIGQCRNAWSQFSTNFSTVISNLRRCSRRVDETADMIRLTRENHIAETITAIENFKVVKLRDINLPCYMIPYGLNLRFFGRSTEVQTLKNGLDPQSSSDTLRVMAIYGLGGVGKTQLALHYANTSMKVYDVIAWIQAETQIKLTQALSNFATKLGLPKPEGSEDDYRSVQKVRDWFNTADKTFLLIFDNVEKAEILDQIWPASNKGSVIITTRSPAIASKRATMLMHLECFTGEIGVETLYSLTRNHPSAENDTVAAEKICELLGGLPLAIAQVSEFIQDRGCSYEEFLAIYRKSADKVFARSEAPLEYSHTLSTVWDVSLQNLSLNSSTLQNMLAFLDPDLIPERLLTNTKAQITDPRLQFLFDDFDFGDAIIELNRASLIHRQSTPKALSVHRMVQFAVFKRLPLADSLFYLDNTIQLLYYGFPNTWNQRGNKQGHGWFSWETCSAVLPHVSWLMGLTEKYQLKATNSELYAELIFRAGQYLWKKEQPTAARLFFEFGLRLDINSSSPACAQAYRLLGHIALDVAQPRAALLAYQRALELRQKLEEPESPPIADVYDSIACSYTEIGNVSQAFSYLSKAAAIHHAHDPSRMARTNAIYAMTYLRAQKPDEALAALKECWRLQRLTQAQIADSKYPKHSGDILLLARIKYAQQQKKEAQQLAARTISIRKGLFGDKGPRVADSLFTVARMLEADGEDVLAAKMLREIVDMSQGMPEMKGHMARALWFLAAVEERIGDTIEAGKLRIKAREERDKIHGREPQDEDADDAFMNLVGWLLW